MLIQNKKRIKPQLVLDIREHYVSVLLVAGEKSVVLARAALLKEATLEPALVCCEG
jgi:hypothetical protein